jgi:hypothetical protein
VELSGKEVKFLEGGPELPASAASPSPAHGRNSRARPARASPALHATRRFDAPAVPGQPLDLGRVADSARVRLNGHDLDGAAAAISGTGSTPSRAATLKRT